MRKQKLFNKGNPVLFIDSKSIKVSPNASRSRNTQEQSIGRSKGGLTTKLHFCFTVSCPVVFCLYPSNSHDTPEGRKPIESIYLKNNNYLLMDKLMKPTKP